jgi:nicotinate-nucleotide--dimethylbenzimidazole phosphoribosyltransferase
VPGVANHRVAPGSADITLGPALRPDHLRTAIETGHNLAADLAQRCDLIVLGEIGIGNTTVAAALLAALTDLPAETVCGRGTGLDAEGLEQKQNT